MTSAKEKLFKFRKSKVHYNLQYYNIEHITYTRLKAHTQVYTRLSYIILL